MKFMMNGALTIGTRDGATIEMAEEAGEENFFLFGLTAEQVAGSRGWYNPQWHYDNEPETRAALDLIFSDYFSRNEPGVFAPLRDALLTHGDYYMHLADLKSYLEADQRLCDLYADSEGWARKAILNVAGSGKFSSDRTIAEYAADIWNVKPCPVSLVSEWSERGLRHMAISPLAGKPAQKSCWSICPGWNRILRAPPRHRKPEPAGQLRHQRHIAARRCTASFNEAHILAITQAICDYRRSRGYDGPLYMGKDTHALVRSRLQRTALEVLAANGVETIIQMLTMASRRRRSSRTPSSSTTAVARADLADGIVITPSHNPPADGGFKYNPPNGGPADTDVTRWIERPSQ